MDALFDEDFLAGKNRRLGVQRVEDRLDQDDVGPAVDQAAQLFAIGDAQIVEGDGAIAGIVHVRRNGCRAVGGPERTGHEPALAVFLLGANGSAAHEARAIAVQLIDHILHAVIGLCDAGGGKGVGFDDVGTSLGVGVVNILNGLGLGQDEKVVVALLMARATAETVAAEMVLTKAKALNLRAHRAVKNKNTLARGSLQRGKDFLAVRLCRNRPE